MGVIITSNSDYGKELAKWEQFPTPWAPVPGRPFMNREFPLMLYKAQLRFDGKVSVGETDDSIFGGAPGIAEQWTKGCQKIVHDEAELERAMDEGWRRNPKDALEVHEKLQRFVETAAAHRAYEDRNMSEAAKKEAAEAEEAVPTHVAEVPEKPRLRRASTPDPKPEPEPEPEPEPAPDEGEEPGEEDTEVVVDTSTEPPPKRKYTRKATAEAEPEVKRKYVRKMR